MKTNHITSIYRAQRYTADKLVFKVDSSPLLVRAKTEKTEITNYGTNTKD